MRTSVFFSLAASLCTLTSLASAWQFSESSLAILEKAGTLETQQFSMGKPIHSSVELPSSATLRIRFAVKNDDGKVARPHQIYALLQDPDSGLETSFPADYRENGRARADIEYKVIPTALLSAKSPLVLKLIIASFGLDTPIVETVGTIIPQKTAVLASDVIRYGPKPEIFHNFGADPKFVSRSIASLFSAVVLGLCCMLLVSWAVLGVKPSWLLKALKSSPFGHVGFFFSIIAIEIFFFKYYLGSTIFVLISRAGVLAPITFFSGSRALREVRARRLAGEW
ncbi:uncharacterized protein V1518DRAFT_409061 [Limtongia smithiae]|uniref:uncharacterized protein n=1 Tax=Limtongia smithiae TaxID=1125753 RepID=UPI0034CFC54C